MKKYGIAILALIVISIIYVKSDKLVACKKIKVIETNLVCYKENKMLSSIGMKNCKVKSLNSSWSQDKTCLEVMRSDTSLLDGTCSVIPACPF